MKTVIIYSSIHHQNTEKVARVMAEELEGDLVPADQAQPGILVAYDLIGFGSGIYYGKHHETLLRFVEELPPIPGKQAFIFSTSGGGGPEGHEAPKDQLLDRGFSIVGEFSCKGWDTWGPLRLGGGINKGRPNEQDLAESRLFARDLKEKYR